MTYVSGSEEKANGELRVEIGLCIIIKPDDKKEDRQTEEANSDFTPFFLGLFVPSHIDSVFGQ
jgi:hypothetical protein